MRYVSWIFKKGDTVIKSCLLISLLMTYCAFGSMGTIIDHYLLLQHPTNQRKLLILSAIPGPRAIAHLHQIAFRTFLSILMTGIQTVELITEDTIPFSEDTFTENTTYKNYLKQRPTRAIKYVSYDFRDKIDADILTVFALIAKEFDTLFETNIISRQESWPNQEFFRFNPAYQIIKNQIIQHAPKITVQEYLLHLQEQKDMFNDRQQFELVQPEILHELQKKFDLSIQNISNWLSNATNSSQTEPLITIILSALETESSIKAIEDIAQRFIDPGTITAHAGFLQGILAGQSQNNAIFFAHARQTNPVATYLQRMGYQISISTPLITTEDKKIKILDGWALINLFQQTFASEKSIEQQRSLLDLFLSHTQKRTAPLLLDASYYLATSF